MNIYLTSIERYLNSILILSAFLGILRHHEGRNVTSAAAIDSNVAKKPSSSRLLFEIISDFSVSILGCQYSVISEIIDIVAFLLALFRPVVTRPRDPLRRKVFLSFGKFSNKKDPPHFIHLIYEQRIIINKKLKYG